MIGGARIARERLDREAAKRARSVGCAPETQLARLVRESANGRGWLTDQGGTGFDIRRFATGVRTSKKFVDPVVELLAFVSLPLFPVRGDGQFVLTRGWQAQSKRGAFIWPTWRDPLDRWAIDALLDRHARARTTSQRQRLGVGSRFRVQLFREPGKSTNCGYDSAPT